MLFGRVVPLFPVVPMISFSDAHAFPPVLVVCGDRLLIIDHELRITAKEALRHPYFADLYEADREFVY